MLQTHSQAKYITACLSIIFCSIFSIYAYSQPVKSDLKIQKIEIADTKLATVISDYISEYSSKNTLFKDGIGFVTLSNFQFSYSNGRPYNDPFFVPANKNVTLNIRAYPLLDKSDGTCISCYNYPLYYTIISGNLVLVYDENLFGLLGKVSLNQTDNSMFFSKRSKKNLQKLVHKFALKDLPDQYVFNDFFEPNISISKLKQRYSQNEILKFYEFIDFKAVKTLQYSFDNNDWTVKNN